MPDYNGAPEVATDLSCTDSAAVEPDVIVDVKQANEWVRLPVTLCEVFAAKDGPSDLTRTGKVKIPGEWNGESIIKYINGFQQATETVENELTGEDVPLTDPYDECRIYFRDEDGVYDIVHFGYVGGVGPAAENGVFKFWVYDVADLMRGIQVTKGFDQPTIQQVLNFVIEGEDDGGRAVGLEARTIFNDIGVSISGQQEVARQKADKRDGIFGQFVDTEGSEGFTPATTGSGLLGGAADIVDDTWDIVTEVGDDILGGGRRRFQRNRHNMVDLMNWFADEVGGKWHFEPDDTRPVLFFDNTAEVDPEQEGTEGEIARRRFQATEADDVENIPFDDLVVFDTIDQLNNNALYDIKPFNTLYLYGESREPLEVEAVRRGYSGSPAAYSRLFPFVKVTYQPLIDRAGGYEYAPSSIESDKTFLKNARAEAIKQFRKHLEEETEGNIEVKGTPHVLPYDYFTAVPVCNDIYENISADPITYEVNRVKHRRAAGERYTTELGVSLVLDETELEVTAEMREA